MAKFCQYCGTEMQKDATFCSKCGKKVGSSEGIMSTQKSKIAAGLLGIFLGSWGIHNFYLGYNNKGILQIILTICSCGIAGIWGFIEGILILSGSINVDANGNPLGE